MRRAAVIGAGVIGLMCAYQLQRRGFEVTVLDRGEPGGACSAGNAGWITPALAGPLPAPGLPVTALRWVLDRDSPFYLPLAGIPRLAGWLAAFLRRCNVRDYEAGQQAVASFNRRTMELFDDLSHDGVTFEMHRDNLMFAFLRRQTLAQTLADLQALHRLGLPAPQVLSNVELRETEPFLTGDVVGGILMEGERHVRPEPLLSALVGYLLDKGVRIVSGTEVTGFSRSGARVTAALTSAEPQVADCFVLSAGVWTGRLCAQLGCPLPICAGKGYSLTIERPAIRLRRPTYLEEARVACSPFEGSLRLAGTMELSGLDDRLDPRRVESIGRSADRYLAHWREGVAVHPWAGMRPLTSDGLPAIGRVPGTDNAFVATGHAMLGVTLAPATAVAIADLIEIGTSAFDLAPFDPGRFH